MKVQDPLSLLKPGQTIHPFIRLLALPVSLLFLIVAADQIHALTFESRTVSAVAANITLILLSGFLLWMFSYAVITGKSPDRWHPFKVRQPLTGGSATTAAGETPASGKLNTIEIKAFIPAKDFALSKAFYQAIGFVKASDAGGVAYFHCGNCSFLLQDFYQQALAENLMMHLLVGDVVAWHEAIKQSGVEATFGVTVSAITQQPWGMADFVVHDPSGVLWRIAQNIPPRQEHA